MIATSLEAPETEMERQLAQIWSDLLNVDLSRIGRHTSFFELGGDSISVIQLISRCKEKGLKMTSNRVFKLQLLSRVAFELQRIDTRAFRNYAVESGVCCLTPIQEFFFSSSRPNRNHYNQSVLWRVRIRQDFKRIQDALNKLTTHHDMLRAKFTENNGVWVQEIQSVEDFQEVAFVSKEVVTKQELESLLLSLQCSLRLGGPLLSSAVIEFSGVQLLFICCHHLVVDLVSWRIIAEDLEYLLKGEDLPSKGTSFIRWSAALHHHIERSESDWSVHLKDVQNVFQVK
jgi:hypothetical protein